MTRARRLTGWLVAGLCLAWGVAEAQVPRLIAYQGRLLEVDGDPLLGAHAVTFRVYDTATGGSKLWEEEHQVTFEGQDDGVFSLVLGSLAAFSSLDFNHPLWMSLEIDGEGEMTPRSRLTAVGYALNADTLDALNSDQFLRSDVDIATNGRLTLTRSGLAFLVQPVTDPAADTKLLEARNAAGSSRFSVDLEGDVAVAGNLSVTGTINGAGVAGGIVSGVTAGAGLTGGGTSGNVSVSLDTPVAVANGGTGASSPASARANLGAAARGVNSDITALTGLTTALSVQQGGTGSTTFAAGTLLTGQGTSAVTTTAIGEGLEVVSGQLNVGCMSVGGVSDNSHAATFQMGAFGGSSTNDRLDHLWPAPRAGIVKDLHAYVDQAPGSGDSWTVTVRKNDANTALSCVMSGSGTSCTAGTPITFVAGDRLGVEFVEGGSAAGTTGSGWSACFVPD